MELFLFRRHARTLTAVEKGTFRAGIFWWVITC